MLSKYIIKCISLGYYKDLKWLQSLFGIPTKSNAYFNKETGKFKLEGEELDLGKLPIVKSDTYIDVIIDGKPKKVTAFRFLDNTIKILKPFNGKIPYQDRPYTYDYIFDKYIVGDLIEGKEGGITIEEYKAYMKAIVFMHGIAPLIIHSNTAKTITPPPGINKYKKELLKEYTAKYGKEVLKDELKMLEIDKKLKAFDAAWMEGDPTMGIVTSKKIMNVSRKSKYISIGKPTALVEGTETEYIEESLADGTPLDAKKIADINNGIRYGSTARGMETQLTGLIAKHLSAATRGFKVVGNDCGVKKGLLVTITNSNMPFIENIRFNSKGKLITNSKEGDVIEMRDYMYCLTKGNGVCAMCVGRVASNIYNPAILTAITTGGKGLASSLSKFHAVVKDVIVLEEADLFK